MLGYKTYLCLSKRLNHPQVAGCSIGLKSCLLHISEWDMDQTKKSKYRSDFFFLKGGLVMMP